jgi:hypothetical protein
VSATLVSERDGRIVLSGSVVVPGGARAALLEAPGRFRLDVQSVSDTLRTTVRHLAGGDAAVRGPGYAGPVIELSPPGCLSPARYDLSVELDGPNGPEEVNVLIGAMGDPDTGLTTFTAQAVVEPG